MNSVEILFGVIVGMAAFIMALGSTVAALYYHRKGSVDTGVRIDAQAILLPQVFVIAAVYGLPESVLETIQLNYDTEAILVPAILASLAGFVAPRVFFCRRRLA